jgi:hypothetical protein
VVTIAVQNIFYLEIYQDDVFLFFKNYFWLTFYIWKTQEFFKTFYEISEEFIL